ncbi:gamma-glutamyl-gamma-aminobutyrate hydrolase family protein [Candidatus Nitronereus thalassa]|uniref:Gamma-glutamyl-gamma-aminobutyrate hydrolase family protein n=1 Tax=Candidatus Nitronereus thalassa TaxID=3020898 RepID=A0ABU3K867_9BACT|nr:gamma-glutamyl-gamma-aminobutyrate hydrolase family protein [Candidatus Nitronereus thalassa]MDT7042596.1 gamma-glutamyl-gamma-aminobutyrate hydrolase family protein [Candidatus Nitronereus thalassa]
MKPIIGVTPDFNAGDRQDMGGKEPTYFLRARYTKAIEDAGGIPFILPLMPDRASWRRIVSHVDGLLITGSGSDLAPETYGEKQRYKFNRMSAQRATLEIGVSKLAYQGDVPTLGICGGMQSINVALGGTLFQDINSQLKTSIPHQPSFSATKPAHRVKIQPRSLLHQIAGKSTIQVNSSHHQSVKDVPSCLVTTAVSSDGVIEAIEAPDKRFLVGVQWHPEFLYERYPIQKKLFQALIKAAKNFSRRK